MISKEKQKARTPKEQASATAYVTLMVTSFKQALPMLREHDWFDSKGYDEYGMGKVIEKLCLKHDVSEKVVNNIIS